MGVQPRKAGFLRGHPYAGALDNHRDEDAGKGKRTNYSVHSRPLRPTRGRLPASGRPQPIDECCNAIRRLIHPSKANSRRR